MSEYKPLNVAVIGCGVICPEHIKAYRLVPGVTVHTLCDIRQDRAVERAKEFQVPNISFSADEVFANPDIDAVSICTDHFSHAALAIAALRAGKHVLCEKPLSSCCENMDAMIEEGDKHPELVFSGIFQHRFNPLYRYVHDLVSSGRIGKILNTAMIMDCLRTREYYEADEWRGKWHTEGGSLLMNQAIHSLDIYQWMLGGVKEVYGIHANLNHQGIIETEDTAVAALRFHNGVLGTVSSSSASNCEWTRIFFLFGVDCSLEIRDATLTTLHCNDKNLEKQIWEEVAHLTQIQAANKDRAYYGIGHPAQIQDFIDAIRSGRKPYVTAKDARESVVLAQKILGRCK